ncbi:MAG: hypothetical protein RBU45_15945 [Myxococcota bacterium]|jgi:hypothetical protein|nr:hypothetical protein [Myxococcota bacterium]
MSGRSAAPGPGGRAGSLGSLLLLLAVSGGVPGCADDAAPAAAVSGDPRIPAAPRCYSPCRDHLLQADGTFRACSDEGLLPGCLGDNVCQDGSCVPTLATARQALGDGDAGASVYPACREDGDCPDFQACLAGRCYSSCEQDGDCESPARCHRHVCRRPCHTEQDPCPTADTVCFAQDGTNGFCLPATSASGDAAPPPVGGYGVSRRLLSFTSVRPSGSFFLTNDSPRAETFVLRKVEHTEYPPEGARVERATPLTWLWLGTAGERSRSPELQVTVPPWSETELFVTGAQNPDRALPRWDGLLEVVHPELGSHQVRLRYSTRADGRWSGTLYGFSSFRDVGVAEWLASGDSQEVENALLRFWDEFVRGQRGWDPFLAMLRATVSGSWQSPALAGLGECGEDSVACFPYDNAEGFLVYTQELARRPIPAGEVQLPFAVDLRETGSPTELVGRIPSSVVLHYPGDPEVRLTFAGDPAAALPNEAGVVLTRVAAFAARARVGGRFLLDGPDEASCPTGAGGWRVTPVPWLVEGFASRSREEDGGRTRYECQDARGGPVGDADPGGEARWGSLTGANPVPDGRARVRELSLVDGALVNQETLVLIVEETVASALGDDDFAGSASYGVLLLTRSDTELPADDLAATAGEEPEDPVIPQPGPACTAELLAAAGAAAGTVFDPAQPGQADALVALVLDGITEAAAVLPLGPDDPWQVHWYCEDTGIFDGIVRRAGEDRRVPCPESSRVRYFLTDASVGRTVPLGEDRTVLDIDHPCEAALVFAGLGERVGEQGDGFADSVYVDVQQRGSCWQTLEDWQQGSAPALQLDPLWRCAGEEVVRCEGDRFDPRQGKLFYAAALGPSCAAGESCPDGFTCRKGSCRQPAPAFVPAASLLQSAFRYKTRFRSRRGENPGFVPEICVPGSDAVPYCYDPREIEQLGDRVACLLDLYARHGDGLEPARAARLRDFLTEQLGYREVTDELERTTTFEGFERLLAELLIMLGDEAYTAAFASRFDLAGGAVGAFAGDRFEPPDGLQLSGGAGRDLHLLYQATQYYGLVLERFFTLGPSLGQELQRCAAEPDRPCLVGLPTVEAWFDRLLRASTQKARAWAEIGRRYQGFDRADLARQVVQRAYAATMTESALLSRLMLGLRGVVRLAQWPGISRRIELAAHGYQAALLAMREVHGSFTDDRLRFGYPANYVPFPALDPLDVNAVEQLLVRAREQVATAAAKERLALAQRREYDTDAAAFGSELQAVRVNYETRLAASCGTFAAADGKIYPAIRKYAGLHPQLGRLDIDPCGLVGTGQLDAARAETTVAALRLDQARKDIEALVAKVRTEQTRVSEQCGLIGERADYVYAHDASVSALEATIDLAQGQVEAIERVERQVETLWEMQKCSADITAGYQGESLGLAFSTDCVSAVIATASLGLVYAANDVVWTGLQATKLAAQESIRGLQTAQTRWLIEQECEVAAVDSDAVVRTLLLDLSHLEFDTALAADAFQLARERQQGLFDEAQRLQQEQTETETLAIDLAAAHQDPNVRIYRNDAVLTADRTFAEARRTLYQATRVFEYHASQSYPHLDDLFLVRMAASGTPSLESYLAGLESDYRAFEEQYGNPDLRVLVLSLRDDLLDIPRLDDRALPLADRQRTQRLRDALADPTRLDGQGYLVIPFATRLDELSPLTHVHKIHHIEVQLLGRELGDPVARVYLRQRGTGLVRDLQGQTQTYLLPERTAVLNAIVGPTRVFRGNAFDGDVYRNRRLRDRPLVNTGWDLVINRRDEAVNQDLDLQTLDDLRLYIYYTDFTELL